MKNKIAQIVVGLPVDGPFDFLVNSSDQKKICKGMRAHIVFGYRHAVGYVVGVKQHSTYNKALKPVISLLDNAPVIDDNILRLTNKFAQYYGCSWGEAIETSLPAGLRKKATKLNNINFSNNGTVAKCPDARHRRTTAEASSSDVAQGSEEITPQMDILQQSHNVDKLGTDKDQKGDVVLCHDKGTAQRWPFIIESIKNTLALGQGIIFLVPEVYAVKKVGSILRKHLDCEISEQDKELSAKKGVEEWLKIKEGHVSLVIGTRSAVFSPVSNLGLIIVYDEDSPFYKQEQTPLYHVREVVEMRSKIEGCSIMYVSPTPSVEVWWRIRKSTALRKTFEAKTISDIQKIDLSNFKIKKNISLPLINIIQQAITNRKKVMLYLNRRGFSTMIKCNKCGESILCDRCGVKLSYLYSKKKLVCYLCNAQKQIPEECPSCNNSYLIYFGAGVEKIESNLSRMFPQAKIERFDRDSKKLSKKVDIIIATQAILGIIDEISVDVISLLDIDSELNRYDFRASQRVFSLIMRLRQRALDKVIIQTQMPDNYSLISAMNQDYDNFYLNEIDLRKDLNFPPFSHIISLGLRSSKEDVVRGQAEKLYEVLTENNCSNIEILEPQPDILPKLRTKFRYTIMLNGKSVIKMQQLIKTAMSNLRKKKDVIITINVDP